MPTLPKIELLEDADASLSQFDVSADVKRSVMDLGFTLPTKPSSGFDPSLMTKDLNGLNDEALGDLLHKLEDWVGWASTELANAKTELATAQAKLALLQSQIKLSLKASGEKLTIPDKTDLMTADPRVCAAEAKVIFCDGRHELISKIVESAHGKWSTVSRIITQRGQAIERMRRGENVSNFPVLPGRTPFRR